MAFRIKCFAVAMMSAFLFSACGPKLLTPKTRLDTPVQHVRNGMKLLKLDKFEAAFREFSRANELDPKLSSPYVGMGLVYGHKGQFGKGLASIRQADEFAKETEQKLIAQVGYMRLYILGRVKLEKQWLRRIEDAFRKAKSASGDNPEPYYYMGVAYKISHDYDKALEQFVRVFEIDNGFVEEADSEYEAIQKIKRTMP